MQVGQIPPGLETGNFYIPICNLPFDTNWKSLKAWLSRDCEVDHVQLYSPTSGWVRVKGPHNFYRACDRMKNGVFNGRRIIFDDSNLKGAVVIKEIYDDENATPASVPLASYPYTSSEASYDQQWLPNVSVAGQTHSNFHQQTAWHPESVSSGGCFASTPASSSSYTAPAGISEQAVPIEHRRIMIKRIGHSTPDDQIKALVKHCLERVTPEKAELQRIEIPRGAGSQNRGHAFATFRSSDVARQVAEILDGKTWNARRLESRLTTEGVTEAESGRASQSQGANSRQRKSNDAPKKRSSDKTRAAPTPSGSSKVSSGESTSSRPSRHRPPTGPIIADGTSHRARSKESK